VWVRVALMYRDGMSGAGVQPWPADLSADGRYTWDGEAWQTNPISPDAAYFWYRGAWHLLPAPPPPAPAGPALVPVDFSQFTGPGLTWTTANFWSDRGEFVLLWHSAPTAFLQGPWTPLVRSGSVTWTARTAAAEWVIALSAEGPNDLASFTATTGPGATYEGARRGYDAALTVGGIQYRVDYEIPFGGAACPRIKAAGATVVLGRGRVYETHAAFDLELHPELVDPAHLPVLLLTLQLHEAMHRSHHGNLWALPHSPGQH
jgi:hypothetical protein